MSNNIQSTFKEFETSVKWLFRINDCTKLENIDLTVHDEKFGSFLKKCVNAKVKITSNNLFDEIKTEFQFLRQLDTDNIEPKFRFLLGIGGDVTKGCNADNPRVQFICNSNVNNAFLAIFLIIKIQYEKNSINSIKIDDQFFSIFTGLVNKIRNEIKEKNIDLESQSNFESKEMSLILVFGKSYWTGIKEIISKYVQKQTLDDNDYNLLQNKYVWYRYKPSNQPIHFEDDTNGNMCFLTINIALDNPPKIGNTMHIQDLIEKTKMQPSIITEMKLGNSFQFGSSGLNAKGFIKV
jgi:hypothetical protein